MLTAWFNFTEIKLQVFYKETRDGFGAAKYLFYKETRDGFGAAKYHFYKETRDGFEAAKYYLHVENHSPTYLE